MRAMVGLHSDFRPIGTPVFSPNGLLFVIPMANVSYEHPQRGRLVTFDVRNAKDEFVHHIQTEISAVTNWAIGWYDDTTVFAKGGAELPEAFIVGTSSLVYRRPKPYGDGLLTAIESFPLPPAKVTPTLYRHKSNRTRR